MRSVSENFPSFFCRTELFNRFSDEEEVLCCRYPQEAAEAYAKDWVMQKYRQDGTDSLDSSGTLRVFVRTEQGLVVPFDVEYRTSIYVSCSGRLAR